jgi:hypothetical protein
MYLRKIKSFREAGYDIVYKDETWVNQNHCTDYTYARKIQVGLWTQNHLSMSGSDDGALFRLSPAARSRILTIENSIKSEYMELSSLLCNAKFYTDLSSKIELRKITYMKK